MRKAVKGLAHITLSLWAFLRLELERRRHGVSRYESKISVMRGAISSHLASQVLRLASE